ncbi:hypothetical protein CI109_105077 [Kwoniella shandongensis]|uniref:Uncharacterized protein n=1 Tax=Kwoniella shandongensis TaxID=1734106 RepID=A0A5M6BX19_9TREE|nr:uncharacterized protein CI109_004323 [Kwoniella shandongensis]KAA5527263.1 hypothetical protein CI109_004323 [Kwoniella shandongensis]
MSAAHNRTHTTPRYRISDADAALERIESSMESRGSEHRHYTTFVRDYVNKIEKLCAYRPLRPRNPHEFVSPDREWVDIYQKLVPQFAGDEAMRQIRQHASGCTKECAHQDLQTLKRWKKCPTMADDFFREKWPAYEYFDAEDRSRLSKAVIGLSLELRQKFIDAHSSSALSSTTSSTDILPVSQAGGSTDLTSSDQAYSAWAGEL